MSRRSPFTAVLIGTMIVSGCDGTTLLINPTPGPFISSTSATSGSLTSAGVTSNTIIPIPPTAVLPDPCTGEDVHVTGTIHLVTVVTVDASGSTHTEMHFNVQGVSGVGLTSGTRYRGIHTETHSSNTAGPAPSEFTTRINIMLISEGGSSNLTIRDALLHVTVNANGTVTASIDHLALAECQ
jgi:hypothetical protein